MNDTAAALNILKAVADTIRELGEVPAGHLYANLMGVMDLQQFDKIIGILVRAGVVKKRGDLLVWNLEA